MKRHYAGAWIEAVHGDAAGQIIGRLRARGYSWRQIARELQISHQTAMREHRRHKTSIEPGKREGLAGRDNASDKAPSPARR